MDTTSSSAQQAARSTGARKADDLPNEGDLRVIDTTLVLLRHGRLVLGLPLLLATIVVIVSLLQARTYTAAGAFAPQAASNLLARFAGVAAQLGVAVPTQQATESADFYADLLRSRNVLSELVHARYTRGRGPEATEGTFIELSRVRGADSADREDRAIRRLSRALSVSVKPRTGVVSFQVTTRDPILSRQLADRTLEVVNRFNLERRQSRAGAERRFVETRLADAERDLRGLEDRLQAWLQQNRDYKDSPRLLFEYQRLSNEVTLKQGVVTTLAQAFEQARIDEVRDTPVLTVVEDPVVPTRPNSRRTVAKAVLAMVFGAGLGVLLTALRERFDRLGANRPGFLTEARRVLGLALRGKRT